MNENAKTPFGDSLNRFTSGKIGDAANLIGKSFPASVIAVNPNKTIVSVKFEVKLDTPIPMIQCPVGTSEYVRLPIQKGDKGFVIPADIYMGGMSGIGGGVATLDQQPNLTNLVWFPCGNIDFSDRGDNDMLVGYGPDGVVLSDKDKVIEFRLSKQDGLIIKWHGQTLMTINNSGVSLGFQNFGIDINGSGTIIDGVNFLPHQHNNVQNGPNNTGAVVP